MLVWCDVEYCSLGRRPLFVIDDFDDGGGSNPLLSVLSIQ